MLDGQQAARDRKRRGCQLCASTILDFHGIGKWVEAVTNRRFLDTWLTFVVASANVGIFSSHRYFNLRSFGWRIIFRDEKFLCRIRDSHLACHSSCFSLKDSLSNMTCGFRVCFPASLEWNACGSYTHLVMFYSMNILRYSLTKRVARKKRWWEFCA